MSNDSDTDGGIASTLGELGIFGLIIGGIALAVGGTALLFAGPLWIPIGFVWGMVVLFGKAKEMLSDDTSEPEPTSRPAAPAPRTSPPRSETPEPKQYQPPPRPSRSAPRRFPAGEHCASPTCTGEEHHGFNEDRYVSRSNRGTGFEEFGYCLECGNDSCIC